MSLKDLHLGSFINKYYMYSYSFSRWFYPRQFTKEGYKQFILNHLKRPAEREANVFNRSDISSVEVSHSTALYKTTSTMSTVWHPFIRIPKSLHKALQTHSQLHNGTPETKRNNIFFPLRERMQLFFSHTLTFTLCRPVCVLQVRVYQVL